jgi:hypothetical protein
MCDNHDCILVHRFKNPFQNHNEVQNNNSFEGLVDWLDRLIPNQNKDIQNKNRFVPSLRRLCETMSEAVR